MEPSKEQPNFVTCPCQHCGGHIKFEGNQLRKGETRTAECPHCHLETILFIPSIGAGSKTSSKSELNELKKFKGFEPFLFQLIRTVWLIVAAILVIVLIVTSITFILTFKPDKPVKIRSVSYGEIAFVIMKTQVNQETQTRIPSENDINSAAPLPKPVATFLANHQDFNPTYLLKDFDFEQKRRFFDNMASILQEAEKHHLSDDQLNAIIQEYASCWKTKNNRKEAPISKYQMRTYCVEGALGTFSALTVFCLILVLLSFERNIKLIAQKLPDSSNTQRSER